MKNSWAGCAGKGTSRRSSRDGSTAKANRPRRSTSCSTVRYVVTRGLATDDVEINRTDDRGVYAGAFQAYLGDRIRQVYNNSLRAHVRSRFFVLGAEQFAQLMREWFPMALHLLEGLFFGTQSTQQVAEQRERLLALGSLSAGLTHELNNPASAAVRATSSLRDAWPTCVTPWPIATGPLDRATLEALVRFQEEAVEHVAQGAGVDADGGVGL